MSAEPATTARADGPAADAAGAAIEVRGLSKAFGDVQALDRVDLAAPAATVLALLGPNGAGKTTVVRTLATLLAPDAGTVRVAGLDARSDPAGVRARIGLTGQFAAVDENLSGRENLVMFGRLYGLRRSEAGARADELIARFELGEIAGRLARTYSGGQRRRFDLAAALVARPAVLFLDEPTVGLDPRSRNLLWVGIERLVAAGTTVLLTTQYLEEADRLADHIAVMDGGRVIARGTAAELKAQVGGERLDVVLARADQAAAAIAALAPMAAGAPTADGATVHAAVHRRDGAVVEAVRRLDEAGVVVDDITLRRPTLDDVFLALTGRATQEEDPS